MNAPRARGCPHTRHHKNGRLWFFRWRRRVTVWLWLHVGDLFQRGHRRKLVAAVVVAMRGVALGPRPFGFVLLRKLVQLAPKILIADGLLIAVSPTPPPSTPD